MRRPLWVNSIHDTFCLVLLVDIVFITAATEFNLLIVIPAALSAR